MYYSPSSSVSGTSVRALALFAALMLSNAQAQTFPLIGGFWSADCDNPNEPITLYTRSQTADYAAIQYRQKRESAKAQGFASFNPASKTWRMQDNIVLSNQQVVGRDITLTVDTASQTFTLVQTIIGGNSYVENGIEGSTGKRAPPRKRCAVSSSSMQTNVPSSDEMRQATVRLPLPDAPPKPEVKTASSSKGAQKHPVTQLVSQAVAASNAGDSRKACRLGREALAMAKKDTGSNGAQAMQMIQEFTDGVCQEEEYAETARKLELMAKLMNPGKDNPKCASYHQAKQSCAPAANFDACMHRMGMYKPNACASLMSPDGW